MKTNAKFWVIILVVALFSAQTAMATKQEATAKENNVAIILASFGTTIPGAVASITNIQSKIQTAFPKVPVKITFTSNIIRSVWKKRQAETKEWLDQGIPAEMLHAQGIISTFGALQDAGYRNIIVQPTHIFFMEQSHDLQAYVNAMKTIQTLKDKWRPFDKIAMGRPALGTLGARHSYLDDLRHALRTLAPDAEQARRNNAILVYMAHGNSHWPTSIYSEAAGMMNRLYPEIKTYIGTVEGYPGLNEIQKQFPPSYSGKVLLKPFMIVAGDHAINDMAGDDPESWKSVLSKQGLDVEPVLEGLGNNDAFASIFIDHIKDAAREAGICLEE